MPRIAFDELPEDARVWIFSAARKLTGPERTRLLSEVDAFLDQWGAHATPLTAGRDFVYGRTCSSPSTSARRALPAAPSTPSSGG